jgi:NTE family protein
MSSAKKSDAPRKINLALQGGGAHGAFTWGVLDGLLEDGRIDIDSISATSAGAMNAAIFAYGLEKGGREGARASLEKFWSEVSKVGAFFSPVRRTPWELASALNPLSHSWSMAYSPAFALFEAVTRTVSPYQFNPLNLNPLRDILGMFPDLDKACETPEVKLFISATNVRTGNSRIFDNKEITVDVLIASTTLPFLFQAVEIGGEHYWDGGYMGNPALWPLYYNSKCTDILLVHVNPIVREELPTKAYAIENRVNEISFNASLLHEMRAISFVRKLLHENMLKDHLKHQYRDILLHAIRADTIMSDLSVASKFDTDWRFLTYLRDLGRQQIQDWLKYNFDHIGKKATVNIENDYLKPLRNDS